MKMIRMALLLTVFSLATFAKPVQVTPTDFGDAKQPQVAINAAGEIFIVFGNTKGVWFTASKGVGKSFSPPVKIAEVKGLALGMRRGLRIAVNHNSVTVTAISHEGGNLLALHSPDGGATW